MQLDPTDRRRTWLIARAFEMSTPEQYRYITWARTSRLIKGPLIRSAWRAPSDGHRTTVKTWRRASVQRGGGGSRTNERCPLPASSVFFSQSQLCVFLLFLAWLRARGSCARFKASPEAATRQISWRIGRALKKPVILKLPELAINAGLHVTRRKARGLGRPLARAPCNRTVVAKLSPLCNHVVSKSYYKTPFVE